ncbi:protein tumorous imaginal discs, mitochondrial-like isoform X1 [Macrosteles quadrilineatus]|uniref:protein tumorous imaginal discs, mitochondrial-like isoform X1 n=1 Tax=Macrosteles quadrilineatus TaxID=74068 RepID=UPI0023E097B6|nr:protein tumorous imaginal discs, mitochondrial-like isoform X1 [Macrosteles quadrilineatus]
MASRGLLTFFGIRHVTKHITVHPKVRFSVRYQQKCSDCGQLLGAAAILSTSRSLVSDNQVLAGFGGQLGHRKLHTSHQLFKKKDYYEVLGVSRNASVKDIKKSYFQLAKKYHPDTNKDADAVRKFQEVSEAYEVLSDDTKRKQYDSWGATSEQMGMGSPPPGGQSQGFNTHNWQFHSTIDPEELFRKIFGEGGFANANFGEDYAESKFGFGAAQEVSMRLTFTQAARGVNKEIHVNVVDTCPKCNGTRTEPGTKAIKCHICNGTGYEQLSTGPFVMRSTCRACNGTRMLIKYPCGECEGKGSNVQRKKLVVRVPPGVEDGQTVRMPVGNKELFITFRVDKSEYFHRDGADVHTDADISLSQAVLGGTIRIQGIYEDHTVQIAPGTSSHTRIRLSDKGLKKVNTTSQYGDHYVHIRVKIPKKLTDKQRALMIAYAELEEDTPGIIRGIALKKDGSKQTFEGEDELLNQVRNALNDVRPERIGKKVVDNVEDHSTDTKRGEIH